MTPLAAARRPLSRAFYRRPAEAVARDLLGTHLISTVGGERAVCRIVETEAYIGPHDPASHAAERIGRTARNASMFGVPGIAYIYRIYGVHWCLNVVTDRESFPAAVLIRAGEPVDGAEVMRRRRWHSARPPARPGADRDLARGPGRLAEALGITGTLDGHALAAPPLVIVRGHRVEAADVIASPRIGITRAHDWPLRFHVRNNRFVSRQARGTPPAPQHPRR